MFIGLGFEKLNLWQDFINSTGSRWPAIVSRSIQLTLWTEDDIPYWEPAVARRRLEAMDGALGPSTTGGGGHFKNRSAAAWCSAPCRGSIEVAQLVEG
jgi:hypothetical protein